MPAALHGCSNATSLLMCYEESTDPLDVVIIPCLLALSTVLVVALILYSLHKNKPGGPASSAHFTNGHQSVSLTTASIGTPTARAALYPWEIPEDFVLEGLELWQTGRHGPICKGLLKKRDRAPSAVVVKCLLDGPNQPEAKEFAEWVLFHATVCKHENVVRMLHVSGLRRLQIRQPPPLPVTCRNKNSNTADPTLNFSERSVFLVAKQVAAGLDYLMSEHRLVHGNVAARNILIGPDLSARVSGLGVAFRARKMDPPIRQRAAEVPLKWQAPERITTSLSIDRSDV